MTVTVELLEYTGKGRPDQEWHAAHLLAFTKNARLGLSADRFKDVQLMDTDALCEELTYMAATIPSSWEFVDLTFIVSNVTRACAQQMTRTRTGSYAMQSQRVTDASQMAVTNPYENDPLSDNHLDFHGAVENSRRVYQMLMDNGAKAEDARGILPINTQCNIVCKYNLRSFVDLVRARKSLRTQSEYRDIVLQMEEQVISVWPWAHIFFEEPHSKAIEKVESVIKEMGLDTGKGWGWELAKAIDLLRK